MEGGEISYMTIAGEFTMALHSCLKVLGEELPGGNYGIWLVMAKPSPYLQEYALFKPNLGVSRTAKSSGFEDIPIQWYFLQMWAAIFEVIKAEASNNPILSLEDIRRAKGGVIKP